MLPVLRKRLKTISDGNRGLQDILQSMQKGAEILSVESYNGKVHNTKITLLVDKGSNYSLQERYEERVHIYNRVALDKVIPANAIYPKTTVEAAIDVLNFQYSCDFTEDDVEFIDGTLVAKETSLGYYNDNTTVAECTNVVNLNWYEESDVGNLPACVFQDWVSNSIPPLVKVGQRWNLSINGTTGSLLEPGSYVSNSISDRHIGLPDNGNEIIVNRENQHFQFKFIYVFKDDEVYDEENETWVDGFTKSGSFKKLLLGPHQTNNSVTVDSYPLEQLWVRYPELAAEDYLEAVEDSVYSQGLNGILPQYIPIPGQDALVIEINILYCPNPNCNPTSLSMIRFNNTIPETHLDGALTIQVVQNGTTVTQIVRLSQVPNGSITALSMIQWFAEAQGIVFANRSVDGFGQYNITSYQIYGSMNESEDDDPNPTSIHIMKTQGEPVETDIFEWLLEGVDDLDAETLAEARSLGLSVRSCGTQYWSGE